MAAKTDYLLDLKTKLALGEITQEEFDSLKDEIPVGAVKDFDRPEEPPFFSPLEGPIRTSTSLENPAVTEEKSRPSETKVVEAGGTTGPEGIPPREELPEALIQDKSIEIESMLPNEGIKPCLESKIIGEDLEDARPPKLGSAGRYESTAALRDGETSKRGFPKILAGLAGIGAVIALIFVLSPRSEKPVVIDNPPPIVTPPPIVQPPPVEKPLVYVETAEERIPKFVYRLIETLNRNSLEEVLDLYDDHVDLLTSGTVDKDFIRKALIQYRGLWPNITYTLSGSVSVQTLGGGEYRVAYTEEFDVYHPGKAKGIRGTAQEFVKLREYGRDFRITDVKEKVLNSHWY